MSLFSTRTFADLVTFTRAGSATYIAEDGTIATASSGAARLDWQAGSLLSGLSVQRRTLTLGRGQYSLAITGTGSVAVRIGGKVVATATSATRRRILVRADDTDVELTPKGSVTAWDMRKALGLLVEPSRTNLLTYSEAFDNAAWTKSNVTISADAITAPDGTLTADKLVENAGTGVKQIFRATNVSVTAGTAYAVSCFMKAAERTKAYWQIASAQFGIGTLTIDLEAGTVVASGTNAPTSALIRQLGGGWWLISCVVTALSSSAASAGFAMRPSATNGDNGNYTGDGTSGLYIWGAQFEQATFPSSYIKTEGSQVTRPADVATIIDSDDYYAVAGNSLTLAATTAAGFGDQVLAQWDDGDESDRVRVVRDSSADLRVIVTAGSAEQANLNLGAVANDTFFTLSLRWQVNGFAASLNGAAEVTDSSGSLPAGITTLRIGADSAGNQWGGHIAYVNPRPRYLSGDQNRDMAA